MSPSEIRGAFSPFLQLPAAQAQAGRIRIGDPVCVLVEEMLAPGRVAVLIQGERFAIRADARTALPLQPGMTLPAIVRTLSPEIRLALQNPALSDPLMEKLLPLLSRAPSTPVLSASLLEVVERLLGEPPGLPRGPGVEGADSPSVLPLSFGEGMRAALSALKSALEAHSRSVNNMTTTAISAWIRDSGLFYEAKVVRFLEGMLSEQARGGLPIPAGNPGTSRALPDEAMERGSRGTPDADLAAVRRDLKGVLLEMDRHLNEGSGDKRLENPPLPPLAKSPLSPPLSKGGTGGFESGVRTQASETTGLGSAQGEPLELLADGVRTLLADVEQRQALHLLREGERVLHLPVAVAFSQGDAAGEFRLVLPDRPEGGPEDLGVYRLLFLFDLPALGPIRVEADIARRSLQVALRTGVHQTEMRSLVEGLLPWLAGRLREAGFTLEQASVGLLREDSASGETVEPSLLAAGTRRVIDLEA